MIIRPLTIIIRQLISYILRWAQDNHYYTMIPDIVPPTATLLFILESPHKEELQHGYPASGRTGREMSKIILGRTDIPLSLIIKCPCISSCLNTFNMNHAGIMNISTSPLQESCYSGQFSNRKPLNMNALNYVRKDLQKVYRTNRKTFLDPQHESAQNQIFLDFQKRLDYVINKNNISKIVPCGHFASYFFNLYCNESTSMANITIINNVPHPAVTGGGWSNLPSTIAASLQALHLP